MEIRKDFDHEGSKVLHMENLQEIMHKGYQNNMQGGLAAYIDQFVSALNEMEILQEEDYTEAHKKQTLMKNIRGGIGIAHLV